MSQGKEQQFSKRLGEFGKSMLVFKVLGALRDHECFSNILKSQLDNIFQEWECLGIWYILKIFPNTNLIGF